jgi:tRNA(Ile2) C34 agmatinyltransferase TiaS
MADEPDPWEPVQRAVAAHRRGQPSDEKCVFCGGRIEVMGEDTIFYFRCPCGKSNGSLKGI